MLADGVTGQQGADHRWLPDGIDGALTRGMEWVMYAAAGLLSGAPRPMPCVMPSGPPLPGRY